MPYNNNQGANTCGSGLSLETIWVLCLNRFFSWLSSLVCLSVVGAHTGLWTPVYMKGVKDACLNSGDPFPDFIMEWPPGECRKGIPPPLISQKTEDPCCTPSLERSVHGKQCHMACASLKPVTRPGSGGWDKRGLVLKHLRAPCPRWKHISCSVPTETRETKRGLVLSALLGSFGGLAQVTSPPLQTRAAFCES